MNLMRADRLATIGLLAAGIAHEINNPLTSIAGFSEGLLKRVKQQGAIDEDQLIRALEDYLQIINQEAHRCSNIIRNLIRYSQKTTENMTSLDIVQIIQDTIVLIQPHARQTGIQLALNDGQTTEPMCLTGSEANLKHLCLTLLNHVLETMESPGTLNISTQRGGNELKVIISHGNFPCISTSLNPHDRVEATPPFHSGKTDIGGLPLSLSICYTIMQQHRGQISLQYGEDHSLAFVLKFPASLP
jgi:two-component system NtrC family sensor kinase